MTKVVSTRADHCAIIEAHNCGISMDELCERFNLKRSTIHRIIRNYEQSGLSLVIKPKTTNNSATKQPKSRTKLTSDQLAEVFAYYNSSSRSYGDVVKFISATFGVTISKTSVGYYIQRARNLLNESTEPDSESTTYSSPPPPSAEDDETHELTIANESNELSETSDVPSVTHFMEASMMTPEDTESEYSCYYDF